MQIFRLLLFVQRSAGVVMFSLKEKLIYITGFFFFIFVGPCVMVLLHLFMPLSFLPEGESNFYLGGLTSAVGLFFAVWANIELVKSGKGGAANLGKLKLMKETQHLVTTGPYAVCRNPMHLGVFLYYMGFACALNSLTSLIIPLLVVIFAYFAAVFLDEPRLKRDFPDEFSVYAASVPRFMPKILKTGSGK